MTDSPEINGAQARDLMRYTEWANDRMLSTMQAADDVPRRAIDLLSHLLRAQDVWLGRVQRTPQADLEIWVEEDLLACARRATASAQRWRTFLEDCSVADLNRGVSYTNSKGKAFETPLRAIVTHVVNHSTHHRAQIALLCREAGIAPAPTDYIFYVRRTDDC